MANIRPNLVAQGEDLVAYASDFTGNMPARLYFFFAAQNSGCFWQHSTASCVCILSSEEELISDLQR